MFCRDEPASVAPPGEKELTRNKDFAQPNRARLSRHARNAESENSPSLNSAGKILMEPADGFEPTTY